MNANLKNVEEKEIRPTSGYVGLLLELVLLAIAVLSIILA